MDTQRTPVVSAPRIDAAMPTDVFEHPLPADERGALQLSDADRERITAAAGQAVDAARTMFRELGFSEAQGTGPVRIDIEPPDVEDPAGHFHNASYDVLGDGISIGHVPWGASYADANDVVAHEFAHRVLEHAVPLVPTGESLTIIESLADVFAATVDSEDWTIAEDVIPGGLRSMSNPARPEDARQTPNGPQPLPDHTDNVVPDSDTAGNPYLNIGIPNRAAALIGDALGRPTMARIYANALRNNLRGELIVTNGGTKAATFLNTAGLAQSTLDAATHIGPEAAAAVTDAWAAVGLDGPAIAEGLTRQTRLAQRYEQLFS